MADKETKSTYSQDKKASPQADAPKRAPKAPVVVTPRPVTKDEKKFTFERWAARKGIPSHHRAGMRAFVSNPDKMRSQEEWDSCFLTY